MAEKHGISLAASCQKKGVALHEIGKTNETDMVLNIVRENKGTYVFLEEERGRKLTVTNQKKMLSHHPLFIRAKK